MLWRTAERVSGKQWKVSETLVLVSERSLVCMGLQSLNLGQGLVLKNGRSLGLGPGALQVGGCELSPRTHVKRWVAMTCACNALPGEEGGRSREFAG